MKSIILAVATALTLTSSYAFSAETTTDIEPIRNDYGYAGFGLGPFPLIVPVFSAGYRTQHGHHGADVFGSVSTLVFVTQLKAAAQYLYYFQPDLSSQFYAGGGLGVSTLFKKNAYVSPELVFGKQYTTDKGETRFLQAQISFPTFRCAPHTHRPFYMPLVVISYGIGF